MIPAFPKRILTGILLLIFILLSGCGVLPPSRPVPLELQPPPFKAPTRSPQNVNPTAASSPGPALATSEPGCTNGLKYVEDLSIPDGMQLPAGRVIEKKWKVLNSGSCAWVTGYSLGQISGDDFGTGLPQALVNTPAGEETILSLQLTLPNEPGEYSASWQAYGPDDQPFGDWLSVRVIVIAP